LNPNKYIYSIAIAAIISWIGWTLILIKINPESHIAIGLPLFLLTLFIASSSTLTLIGYYLRSWLYKDEEFHIKINTSFRQGILLSLVIIFCTIFEILKVLNWLSAIILLFIALLIEFYLASKE
jgi:hypothetical protein